MWRTSPRLSWKASLRCARVATVLCLILASLVFVQSHGVDAWNSTELNIILNQSNDTWVIDDLDVDNSDNIISVGRAWGPADFDPSTSSTASLPRVGPIDAFIQKITRDGTFLWAYRFGDSGATFEIYPRSVVTDGNGNVYVAGQFQGTVDFDTSAQSATYSAGWSADAFVMKLNSSGQFQWVVPITSPGGVTAFGITIDDANRLTIVGSANSASDTTIDFDPVGANEISLLNANLTDVFVAQYSSTTGEHQWSRLFGSTDYEQGYGVTTDAENNVIVSGSFGKTVDFDPSSAAGSITSDGSAPNNLNFRDGFILKLSSAGSFVWVNEVNSSSGSGQVYAADTDAMGRVYITGTVGGASSFGQGDNAISVQADQYYNDTFVAGMNANGTFRWAKVLGPGGSRYDTAKDIVVDSDGNVVAGGSFWGTVRYNPGSSDAPVEMTAQDHDAFIVRYTPDGDLLYARKFSSQWYTEEILSIAADSRGNVYTTSYFLSNQTDLDTEATTVTAPRDGGASFIARVDGLGSTRTKPPRAPRSATVDEHVGKITVSWDIPIDDGGAAVTEYTATASPSGELCTVTVPTTTCDITGLDAGVQQEVTVVAKNRIGDSVPSTAVNGSSLGLPFAPVNVVGTSGDKSVGVSWVAPTNTGGRPIVSYTVTAAPGGSSCTTSATTCTISKLRNGVAYTFTVIATTALGDSTSSAPSDPVTPTALPEPPQSVWAIGGDESAIVQWSEVADDGGFGITGFRVIATPGGAACSTASVSQKSCTLTGLSNGVEYRIGVRAVSQRGESLSESTTKVKPGRPTSAPRNVEVQNVDGSVTLLWSPPRDLGGHAIQKYEMEVSTNGGDWMSRILPASSWIDPANQPRSRPYQLMTGLSQGASYRFRLRAVNAYGGGEWARSESTMIDIRPRRDFVTPDRVPVLSYMTFAVRDNTSEWFEVSPQSRTCDVDKGIQNPDQYTRRELLAIVFIQPGKCVVDVYRNTPSVRRAKVATLVTDVRWGEALSPSIKKMEYATFEFTNSNSSKKPTLTSASTGELRLINSKWSYRQHYGDIYTYCHENAFDKKDQIGKDSDIEALRCKTAWDLLDDDVVRTQSARFVKARLTEDDDDTRRVTVALAPIFDPPTAPLNLSVKRQAYSATVTWDEPEDSGGSYPVYYKVSYRFGSSDKWVVTRTEQKSFQIDIKKWNDIPTGQEIEFNVQAYTFQSWSGPAAREDFKLRHRLPVVLTDTRQAQIHSVISVLSKRGNPRSLLLLDYPDNSGTVCVIGRERSVMFLAPGTCNIRVGQPSPDGSLKILHDFDVKVGRETVQQYGRLMDVHEVAFKAGSVEMTNLEAVDQILSEARAVHVYIPDNCGLTTSRLECRQVRALEQRISLVSGLRGNTTMSSRRLSQMPAPNNALTIVVMN